MRKGQWILLGAIVLGLTATGGWFWTHREPPPKQPPEVPIEDPAVAAAVAKARAKILARAADAAAWGELGQVYLANGFLSPAHECFAEAGRLDARDARWPYLEGISLLLSDPVSALPCWQRAAECPGEDDRAATARLRWAEALLANDRFAEAETVLRGVLKQHPENIRVQLDLGLLAVAMNNPKTAIEHFRKCLDDPSARRKAYTHLATLSTAQGNSVDAAEYARRAGELPPDYDWPDQFLEGYLTYTIGREGMFLQAEKQLQQGSTRQAIALFEEVIRQYPEEERAYAKLGMILDENGDYIGAEAVLRAGLQVSPGLVQAHFFLAVSLFNQAEKLGFATPVGQERLRDALKAAQKATELKPDHGFAHLYRGLALSNLGRKTEALAALREAVRCTPEAADPHLHLGQLLWDEGKAEEAIAELEIAARVAAPTDQRPRAVLDRIKKAVPKPDKK